jgi:hypothetical protein
MDRSRRRQPGATSGRPYRGPGAVDALGVDVGGVIIDRIGEGTDTSFFGDRHLHTPAVAGAVDGLRVLTMHFQGRVYIISKAGPKVEGKTREWLDHHDVFTRTGVSAEQLFFVRDRKGKALLCRKLGITHFVDDRLDVLLYLDTVEHRYLFVGGLGRHPPPAQVPEEVSEVSSWPDLVAQIR